MHPCFKEAKEDDDDAPAPAMLSHQCVEEKNMFSNCVCLENVFYKLKSILFTE